MVDGGAADDSWDFLVSYAPADRAWAEWIAWTLEEATFRVLVQAWDFVPGSNWLTGVDEGVRRSSRTIAVLSEDYARSVRGASEWRAAWAEDPDGTLRKLLTVRVADCARPGLLSQVVSVDLFGLGEDQAREGLLGAARTAVSGGRAKPDSAPPFPPSLRAVPSAPAYPGAGSVAAGETCPSGQPVWVSTGAVASPGARAAGPERRARRPWMVPEVGQVVDRGALADALADRLVSGGAGWVGVTAGVEGAGGFGKTTLAAMVCSRRDVRSRFPGGLVWVTVGEQVAGAELAGLVNDVCEALSGERPSSSNPLVSGARLAETLESGPDTLLVLDDVWTAGQLAPFLVGATDSRRLVTTRNRGILPRGASSVLVDAMTPDQATTTLQMGLDKLAPDLVARLSRLTGRWPVLLGLVNAAVHDRVVDGASADQAARWVAGRLADEGPTALDVTDEQNRHLAVASTLAVSLERLTPVERELYRLLAVFPEDTDLPADVLSLLWGSTGQVSEGDLDDVRERLVRLRLVAGSWAVDRPAVRLHDVVRDYLRRQLSRDQVAVAHRQFLAAARRLVPEQAAGAAWWDLSPSAAYL